MQLEGPIDYRYGSAHLCCSYFTGTFVVRKCEVQGGVEVQVQVKAKGWGEGGCTEWTGVREALKVYNTI